MNFNDGQITNQKEDVSISKTLPRSLRYRSFNNDLRSAPTKRSQLKIDSGECLLQQDCLKSTTDNVIDDKKDQPITDLVPDFSLG